MKQRTLNRLFMYENAYFLMPQENIAFVGFPNLTEEVAVEVDAVEVTHFSKVNKIEAKARKLPPPNMIIEEGISQMLQNESKLAFFNSYIIPSSKRFQGKREALPSTRKEYETYEIIFCRYKDNGRMLVPIGYLEKLFSTKERHSEIPAFL